MFLDALLGSSNPRYCVLFLLVRYNVQCTELRFLDLNPSIECLAYIPKSVLISLELSSIICT